jgi:hypothetical protein
VKKVDVLRRAEATGIPDAERFYEDAMRNYARLGEALQLENTVRVLHAYAKEYKTLAGLPENVRLAYALAAMSGEAAMIASEDREKNSKGIGPDGVRIPEGEQEAKRREVAAYANAKMFMDRANELYDQTPEGKAKIAAAKAAAAAAAAPAAAVPGATNETRKYFDAILAEYERGRDKISALARAIVDYPDAAEIEQRRYYEMLNRGFFSINVSSVLRGDEAAARAAAAKETPNAPATVNKEALRKAVTDFFTNEYQKIFPGRGPDHPRFKTALARRLATLEPPKKTAYSYGGNRSTVRRRPRSSLHTRRAM